MSGPRPSGWGPLLYSAPLLRVFIPINGDWPIYFVPGKKQQPEIPWYGSEARLIAEQVRFQTLIRPGPAHLKQLHFDLNNYLPINQTYKIVMHFDDPQGTLNRAGNSSRPSGQVFSVVFF